MQPKVLLLRKVMWEVLSTSWKVSLFLFFFSKPFISPKFRLYKAFGFVSYFIYSIVWFKNQWNIVLFMKQLVTFFLLFKRKTTKYFFKTTNDKQSFVIPSNHHHHHHFHIYSIVSEVHKSFNFFLYGHSLSCGGNTSSNLLFMKKNMDFKKTDRLIK